MAAEAPDRTKRGGGDDDPDDWASGLRATGVFSPLPLCHEVAFSVFSAPDPFGGDVADAQPFAWASAEPAASEGRRVMSSAPVVYRPTFHHARVPPVLQLRAGRTFACTGPPQRPPPLRLPRVALPVGEELVRLSQALYPVAEPELPLAAVADCEAARLRFVEVANFHALTWHQQRRSARGNRVLQRIYRCDETGAFAIGGTAYYLHVPPAVRVSVELPELHVGVVRALVESSGLHDTYLQCASTGGVIFGVLDLGGAFVRAVDARSYSWCAPHVERRGVLRRLPALDGDEWVQRELVGWPQKYMDDVAVAFAAAVRQRDQERVARKRRRVAETATALVALSSE